MNFCSQLKENIWIGAGSLIGLTLGSTYNLMNTGSFFGRDANICKNPFGSLNPLLVINNFRENEYLVTRKEHSLGLINPLCPLIYLVPIFANAVLDTAIQKKSFKESFETIISQAIKIVATPIFYSMSMAAVGLIAKGLMSASLNIFSNSALDTAGHVIFQMIQHLCILKALQGYETSSLQKKMFTILHVSVAVTDGIWMFNTASGCHSVADVIAGIACIALAYEVTEYVKFRISLK